MKVNVGADVMVCGALRMFEGKVVKRAFSSWNEAGPEEYLVSYTNLFGLPRQKWFSWHNVYPIEAA